MKKILLLLYLASCSVALSQNAIRVCTYNALDFNEVNSHDRTERFERILKVIKPDILLVTEVTDSYGAGEIMHSYERAMNYGHTASSRFNNGAFLDKMVYINREKIEIAGFGKLYFMNNKYVEHWIVKVIETNDTLHIFNVNVIDKVMGVSDVDRRSYEIRTMKEFMPQDPNINLMVIGNLFFLSPTEEGYTTLTNTYFHPLIDPVGVWERNSSEYSKYYTQSTRKEANVDCGGGIGGGLTDRFDYILYSETLKDNYIPNSFTVFGNDGLDRRTLSINNPPNKKVSIQITAFQATISSQNHHANSSN